MKTPSSYYRVQIYLRPDVFEKVKAEAENRDMTVAGLAKTALYLEADIPEDDRMRKANCSMYRHRAGKLGDPLTPRLLEVLELLRQRKTYKEIGAALRISSNTVHRHVSTLLTRTGANTRYELALLPPASLVTSRPALVVVEEDLESAVPSAGEEVK